MSSNNTPPPASKAKPSKTMQDSFESWCFKEGCYLNSRICDDTEPDYELARQAFNAGWAAARAFHSERRAGDSKGRIDVV